MRRDRSYPPYLVTQGLDADEGEVVQGINRALMHIRGHASDFRSALDLYDVLLASVGQARDAKDTKTVQKLSSWQGICFRDASMQLSHFGKALQALSDLTPQSPTLSKLISRKSMSAANKLWHSDLAQAAKVRNSVAHQGEHFIKPEKFDRHALKDGTHGGPGQIVLSGGSAAAITLTVDRVFSVPIDGQLVSMELSEGTADKLDQIAEHIFDAYEPADAPLHILSFTKDGNEPPWWLLERLKPAEK